LEKYLKQRVLRMTALLLFVSIFIISLLLAYSRITALADLALVSESQISLLGKEGLQHVAAQSAQRAHYLASKIASIPGFSLKYKSPFFREFVVETPIPAAILIEKMLEQKVFAGYDLAAHGETGLLVAVTEKRSRQELDRFVEQLGAIVV
jgi:glycine dehydrogenase subunit 1